jgi:hypothetical protein
MQLGGAEPCLVAPHWGVASPVLTNISLRRELPALAVRYQATSSRSLKILDHSSPLVILLYCLSSERQSTSELKAILEHLESN